MPASGWIPFEVFAKSPFGCWSFGPPTWFSSAQGWYLKKTVGNQVKVCERVSRAKHIERMNSKHSSDFGKMEPVMMVYMNDLDPTILKIEM